MGPVVQATNAELTNRLYPQGGSQGRKAGNELPDTNTLSPDSTAAEWRRPFSVVLFEQMLESPKSVEQFFLERPI